MRISILLCTHRTNRILGVESKSTPSHRSQTQRRMGHPQALRPNLGVTCSSGIILSERVNCGHHGYKAHRGAPPARPFGI